MPRPQLTKTESLIYRTFIVAYLLFIVVIIGACIYGAINHNYQTNECGAKETTK